MKLFKPKKSHRFVGSKESFLAIQSAVKEYKDILSSVRQENLLSNEKLLDILVARDRLEELWSDRDKSIKEVFNREIQQLDRQLRKLIRKSKRTTTDVSFNTGPDARFRNWWWRLKPPPPYWDRFDLLFDVLAVFFLAWSVSLIINISSRFLEGGPDALGAFAVIIQGAAAFVIGRGAITNQGRAWVERGLTRFGIPERWRDEVICLAAFVLLLLSILIQNNLFVVAQFYQCLGDSYYEYQENQNPHLHCVVKQALQPLQLTGSAEESKPKSNPDQNNLIEQTSNTKTTNQDQNDSTEQTSNAELANQDQNIPIKQISNAESSYLRAIRMSPSYVDAHFALANLYFRDLRNFEQALYHYRQAVKLGEIRAYDGIAQIYLRQGEPNVREASQWLLQGLGKVKEMIVKNVKQCRKLEQAGAECDAVFYQMLETLTRIDNNYKDSQIDAIPWLNQGLFIAEQRNDTIQQSVIYKNIGWVHLEQADYIRAESKLREAIHLDEENSAAYCLLARSLSEQTKDEVSSQSGTESLNGQSKEIEEALEAWNTCRKVASGDDPDERVWLVQAEDEIIVLERMLNQSK